MSFFRKGAVRTAAFVLTVVGVALMWLVLETTYASIPGSLADQVAWLQSIPAGWLPELAVVLWVVVFSSLAPGPDRIQGAYKAASDLRHVKRRRIEELEEEIKRLKAEGAWRDYKLKAYESRDSDRVVFELSPGRDFANQPAERRDAEGYAECLVPYDPTYNTLPGSRTTFSIGAFGAEYSVTLGHEAYEKTDPPRLVPNRRAF